MNRNADEQHDALSGYVQALNRSVTLVYSRENSQVQSVQWYTLMSGDSSNADIYANASTAGEAAAAVVTALFFADSGLDMATMGANINALQTEFNQGAILVELAFLGNTAAQRPAREQSGSSGPQSDHPRGGGPEQRPPHRMLSQRCRIISSGGEYFPRRPATLPSAPG